jgi:AcrR family transcriptional regulator
VTPEKRPYLHRADRHRQLLDAAAAVLARSGLGGLTMVAVAAEAGVSRRLCYDHFADLATLYIAVLEDRGHRYLAGVDAVARSGADATTVVLQVFPQLLAMAPQDRRAIAVLMADTGSEDLAPARRRFHEQMVGRWSQPLAALGLSDSDTRALVWTVSAALMAMAGLVEGGEVSVERATELVADIVDGLVQRLGASDNRLRRFSGSGEAGVTSGL